MTSISDMLINLRLLIACYYVPLMFFGTISNFFTCFANIYRWTIIEINFVYGMISFQGRFWIFEIA